MKLSREKINHLSKVVLKDILAEDDIEYFVEDNELRLAIVKVLTDELTVDDQVDQAVRKTINSYGKDIREGTDEWAVLYERHYAEETKKRRGIDI